MMLSSENFPFLVSLTRAHRVTLLVLLLVGASVLAPTAFGQRSTSDPIQEVRIEVKEFESRVGGYLQLEKQVSGYSISVDPWAFIIFEPSNPQRNPTQIRWTCPYEFAIRPLHPRHFGRDLIRSVPEKGQHVAKSGKLTGTFPHGRYKYQIIVWPPLPEATDAVVPNHPNPAAEIKAQREQIYILIDPDYIVEC